MGALASGIFAVALGSGIESNAPQIVVQLKGIAFVVVFAPLCTVIILSGLKMVFGSPRADEEDEMVGLDLSQHSETAYSGVGSGGHFPEGLHSHASHMVAEPARQQHFA